MGYDALFSRWCGLTAAARVMIVTDPAQRATAERIAAEMARTCEMCLYEASPAQRERLAALSPEDLVIVLLSFASMLDFTRERWFSPFGKPEWLRAKCAFIRLSISQESLREGLSTPREAVYAKIAERDALPVGCLLRVTNAAGTDLTLRTGAFTTCTHEIDAPGGHCFLPPSETTSEVVSGSANGRIVVDVTLGQVHRFAEELGYFLSGGCACDSDGQRWDACRCAGRRHGSGVHRAAAVAPGGCAHDGRAGAGAVRDAPDRAHRRG